VRVLVAVAAGLKSKTRRKFRLLGRSSLILSPTYYRFSAWVESRIAASHLQLLVPQNRIDDEIVGTNSVESRRPVQIEVKSTRKVLNCRAAQPEGKNCTSDYSVLFHVKVA
jgi:hypothetical protein